MGPEGTGNPDINAIAGDAVEGMLTLPADFSQSAANAEIVKAFQAKKRNAAGAFQMTAYTATPGHRRRHQGRWQRGSGQGRQVPARQHARHPDRQDLLEQGDLTNFQFDVFTWHKDGSKTVYK